MKTTLLLYLAVTMIFSSAFAYAASKQASQQTTKQISPKKAVTSQTFVGQTVGCTGGKVMSLSKQCVCPSNKFESADGKQCLNACPAGQKADRRQKCMREMMWSDRQGMEIMERIQKIVKDEPIFDYTFEEVVKGNVTLITQDFFSPEFINKLNGFDFHPENFGPNSILVITQKPLEEVVQLFDSVPGTFQLCEISKNTGNGGSLTSLLQRACGGQGSGAPASGSTSLGDSMPSGDSGFNVFTSACGGGGGGSSGSDATAGSGSGSSGSGATAGSGSNCTGGGGGSGSSAGDSLGHGSGGSGGGRPGNAFDCGQEQGRMQILRDGISRQGQVSEGGGIGGGFAQTFNLPGGGQETWTIDHATGTTTLQEYDSKGQMTFMAVVNGSGGIETYNNEDGKMVKSGSGMQGGKSSIYASGNSATQVNVNGNGKIASITTITKTEKPPEPAKPAESKPAETAKTEPAKTEPSKTEPQPVNPTTGGSTPNPEGGVGDGNGSGCRGSNCGKVGKPSIPEESLRNERLAAQTRLQMMFGMGVTNPGETGAGRFGIGGGVLSPCSGEGGGRYLRGDGSGGRGAGYGRTDPSPESNVPGQNTPDPCKGPGASGLSVCQSEHPRDKGRGPDPKPNSASQGINNTMGQTPANSMQRSTPAGRWKNTTPAVIQNRAPSVWKNTTPSTGGKQNDPKVSK